MGGAALHGHGTDWFDQNRPVLRRLFDALGAAASWSDEDDAVVAFMERTWLGSEHGTQAGKPVFTADQEQAALPLLDELGFLRRVPPPSPGYDEIVVLGAAAIGLHRRLELVRTSGVTAPRLTILAGLRPHERAPRDGAADELLDQQGRFSAAPGWQPEPLHTHLHRLLVPDQPAAAPVNRVPPTGEPSQSGDELAGETRELIAAAAMFPDEAALAALLLTKQWPDARLAETVHAPPHSEQNELGQRTWHLRTWRAGGSIKEIRVLNGAPVHRPGRPSRPTSASTMREWLELTPQSEVPRTVLVVVNQPHLGRTELELLTLLRSLGRDDLNLAFAGAGANLATSGAVLVLGEIPARIRVDRQRLELS